MHICIKIPLAMITTDSILSIAVTLTILFSAYHPFSNGKLFLLAAFSMIMAA